jgi:hypothetical protein
VKGEDPIEENFVNKQKVEAVNSPTLSFLWIFKNSIHAREACLLKRVLKLLPSNPLKGGQAKH